MTRTTCTRQEDGARSLHCWGCYEEGRDERSVDGLVPAIVLILTGAVGAGFILTLIRFIPAISRLLP